VAYSAALYGRIIAEVSRLYEVRIAAKDEVIAAQRDLIGQSLADTRDQLAHLRAILAITPKRVDAPTSTIGAMDAKPPPLSSASRP
jgi:hypothetical protein